ncbi:hypothetical protein GCM10010218_45050 [Streptomyces mashuensis]|uniref:Uncharacterized protein n=1 Tax=Streptomyces mashuensis TaxID=33904 RepID=A0A919EEZ0_9ACTN|nr:hypothetical protein GCM10010218_45050 [Streptomyces mashuensis]
MTAAADLDAGRAAIFRGVTVPEDEEDARKREEQDSLLREPAATGVLSFILQLAEVHVRLTAIVADRDVPRRIRSNAKTAIEDVHQLVTGVGERRLALEEVLGLLRAIRSRLRPAHRRLTPAPSDAPASLAATPEAVTEVMGILERLMAQAPRLFEPHFGGVVLQPVR